MAWAYMSIVWAAAPTPPAKGFKVSANRIGNAELEVSTPCSSS
jgi:hypothetical protein